MDKFYKIQALFILLGIAAVLMGIIFNIWFQAIFGVPLVIIAVFTIFYAKRLERIASNKVNKDG